MGNGDRELVEAFDAGRSGARREGDQPFGRAIAWAAARLGQSRRDRLDAYEPTVAVEIDGLLALHCSRRTDAH